MAQTQTGQIRQVPATDDLKLPNFSYIQAGGAGTITVRRLGGTPVTLSANILAKLGVIPVGIMDEVLATGTTATDIYVW